MSKYLQGRSWRIAALVVVYLALSAPLLFTQTTGPGTGKGRVSKVDEPQQGLKPDAPAAVARLKMPDKALAPKEVAGKMEHMEEHLKSFKAPTSGTLQPRVDTTKAAQAPKSAGAQQGHGGAIPAVPAAAAATTHLHLVIHITATGQAEVIRATEVPGEVILHNEPTGHYIYEVARAGTTVAVQAIPDPFEHRSFEAIAGPLKGHGHHIEQAKEADIVVKVPNTNLTNVATLHLSLYKLKPGGRPLERIDAAAVTALKQANRLDTHFELAPAKLAPQINKLGKKLEVHVEPPK